MLIGRLIGWLLTLAGLASAAASAVEWYQTGDFRLTAAGEMWFRLAPDSLNLVQAVIQRYLIPELWDPILQTILLWPAVAVLLVPGLLLIWLCQRR